MQETILFKILWILTPCLVGIIGFFIVRSMAKTDSDVNKLFEHIEKLNNRINDSEEKLNCLYGEHHALHGDRRKK